MGRLSKVLRPEFALLFFGALCGGFIGAFAGLTEYLVLSCQQAFSGDQVKGYWDIMLPYTLVGVCSGLLVAVGVCLWSAPSSFRQHLVRLVTVLLTSVVLAYLVGGVVSLQRIPAPTPSNLLIDVAAAAVACVLSVPLYRLLHRLITRLEGSSKPLSPRPFSIKVPASLILLTAGILFLPAVYLQRPQSSQRVSPGAAVNPTPGKRPNVVFILVDTLRADHLPMYGYSRQTAPTLTALAQQGIAFSRMYTQAPWTKPSVATLFSSLYPTVHKVNRYLDCVTDSITALPEVLRANGYKTFGVSANALISPTFGYAQGFDELRVWGIMSAFRLTVMGRLWGVITDGRFLREGHRTRAGVVTDAALEWVSQNQQVPFFLYIHYLDPHWPYRPPAPYDQAFNYRTDPPRRAEGSDPLKLPPNKKAPERIGRILDQYDGEILYTDAQIARLLQGLEQLGLLKDALVIVTSDHGEEFYEHGRAGHGQSVYEELLRVPFLLWWPGHLSAGDRYDAMVGLIDVMPTLLTLLEIEAPLGLQGTSFAAALLKLGGPQPERALFAEVFVDGVPGARRSSALVSVSAGRNKLIRHLYGPQQGLEEFYDLETDPLEQTNRASQAQMQVAALRQELDGFNALTSEAAQRVEAQQLEKLDRDTERKLRSLGYIK